MLAAMAHLTLNSCFDDRARERSGSIGASFLEEVDLEYIPEVGGTYFDIRIPEGSTRVCLQSILIEGMYPDGLPDAMIHCNLGRGRIFWPERYKQNPISHRGFFNLFDITVH
jgi:hypothetical protein